MPTAPRSPLRSPWLPGLLTLLALAVSAPAQEARPKRRDSRVKPPEVTYETRVEPATAKPGETVKLSVIVKVDAPWHIYAFAAEQPAEGPRATQFDLFDAAGLEPSGAWVPDSPPIRKKEPAFPDLDAVEFHERQVAWSTTLKVPADAKAGPHALKAQIYFQICDENACKPPTYATLPEAIVTVAPAGAAGGGSARAGRPFRPDTLIAALSVALQDSPAPATPPEAIAPPSAPEPAAAGSEVEAKIQEGLVPFLLFAALNGLLALLMPCVWPMVPITVNFFLKQGQSRGRKPIGLALVYCLSIIGIFTGIGLFFSIVFGAASTTALGNNPWLNLLFGLAFIAMGLSLLGLFEIRLPSAWLNKSAALESKGGLLGVMFMAVTLTITSFTCTAPLVGQLLFLASKGSYLYPTLGLLTFAAVLALPFFVLALVPSLLQSVPRSGDWMNSVKVVGGLLEIAAAFKFLNTAETSFRGGQASEAILDAQVVLSVWVVSALVAGIYLLGLFRTDHDLEAPRVGPLRLVGGTLFLALALYLTPALFGNPPDSELYKSIAGIFPQDSLQEFDQTGRIRGYVKRDLNTAIAQLIQAGVAPGQVAATGSPAPALEVAVEATSNDPQVAIREQRELVHGLSWGFSYDAALEEANKQGRPILVDFTGVNCANCRTMEAKVMPDPAVEDLMSQFVRVRLYTDYVPIKSLSKEDTEYLGEDNLDLELKLVNQSTSPFYVVLDPTGKVLAQKSFDPNVAPFISFLKNGLATFESGRPNVASN
jgi:thiol:disulfide interchange protein DsbD